MRSTPFLWLSLMLPASASGQDRPEPRLGIEISSGLSSFPDVQVPIDYADYSAPVRADGTKAGTENATHRGFPLSVAARYTAIQAKSWMLHTFATFTTVPAAMGPPDTLNASYLTIAAGIGPSVALFASRFELGLLASVHRTAYMNVSTGHALDALLFEPRLSWRPSQRLVFSGFMATSALSRFSYLNGQGFLGQSLANATADLDILGVSTRYALTSVADLILGIETERAAVTVPNVIAYRNTGLRLTFPRQESLNLTLETQVIKLGCSKKW